MHRTLLDTDSVLSEIDQWTELDAQWGEPVDLETEEHDSFSHETELDKTTTLDRRVTFDSAVMLKKIHEKITKNASKDTSVGDYEEFLRDLNPNTSKNRLKEKPAFYYVAGQIISAASVNDICNTIDNIFKSIEKLNRGKRVKNNLGDVIECSISTTGLSFDETLEECLKEKTVDEYIDELFNTLESTVGDMESVDVETGQESVSTLVKKYTSYLCSPVKKCGKRKRECSKNFKELTEFWKVKSCNV